MAIGPRPAGTEQILAVADQNWTVIHMAVDWAPSMRRQVLSEQ
jgi:hypothetical protein